MVKKETPAERLNEFTQFHGVNVLNLIIERHKLSEEKRTCFSVRFVEQDPVKEKEYTEMMDKLGQKIYKVDEKLYEAGIEPKERTQILRDIKKVYPAGEWLSGFSQG